MAARSNMIVVGIKGTVLAIDRDTGETLWSTALKGSDFVNVSLEGGDVFASSKGRLYRLDATTARHPLVQRAARSRVGDCQHGGRLSGRCRRGEAAARRSGGRRGSVRLVCSLD